MIDLQTKQTTASYLQTLSIFHNMKPESLLQFAAHARHVYDKKGSILFFPDSANEKFYIVKKGWVKLFRETLSGVEAVIDVIPAGHFFGEIGLTGADTMPYGAEVIDDAEIITLPRFLLTQEVLRNGLFGLNILQFLSRQKKMRDDEIEHRTVQTAPQRIGCFLLKFSRAQETGPLTLHLPYDKTVVAYRLGMQPETFSRALAKLKEELHLSIKGSTIEIPEIANLVKYTCVACSDMFPCSELR
jgi:CRP-like cAMP-binding protein